jgi:hypothetical protein
LADQIGALFANVNFMAMMAATRGDLKGSEYIIKEHVGKFTDRLFNAEGAGGKFRAAAKEALTAALFVITTDANVVRGMDAEPGSAEQVGYFLNTLRDYGFSRVMKQNAGFGDPSKGGYPIPGMPVPGVRTRIGSDDNWDLYFHRGTAKADLIEMGGRAALNAAKNLTEGPKDLVGQQIQNIQLLSAYRSRVRGKLSGWLEGQMQLQGHQEERGGEGGLPRLDYAWESGQGSMLHRSMRTRGYLGPLYHLLPHDKNELHEIKDQWRYNNRHDSATTNLERQINLQIPRLEDNLGEMDKPTVEVIFERELEALVRRKLMNRLPETLHDPHLWAQSRRQIMEKREQGGIGRLFKLRANPDGSSWSVMRDWAAKDN